MFQLDPVQLPNWSFREIHCCWLPEFTWPSTWESPRKPPLDQPPLSSRIMLPWTCTRLRGDAWDTAHLVLLDEGAMVRFSADRQKFVVAFPPFQAASAWT